MENVPAEEDQGINVTLRQSTGNITKTTRRGTAVTFTGLDEHYGNAAVIMTDVASGVSWTMSLNVAQQIVTYGAGTYTQGQTIILDTASIKFKIPSPYAISVYSPYNNKTYSLSASIGFKRLTEPSNVNKSSIMHKNVLYKQGSFIRLIAN